MSLGNAHVKLAKNLRKCARTGPKTIKTIKNDVAVEAEAAVPDVEEREVDEPLEVHADEGEGHQSDRNPHGAQDHGENSALRVRVCVWAPKKMISCMRTVVGPTAVGHRRAPSRLVLMLP